MCPAQICSCQSPCLKSLFYEVTLFTFCLLHHSLQCYFIFVFILYLDIPHGFQDLRSLTWDWACTLCRAGSAEQKQIFWVRTLEPPCRTLPVLSAFFSNIWKMLVRKSAILQRERQKSELLNTLRNSRACWTIYIQTQWHRLGVSPVGLNSLWASHIRKTFLISIYRGQRRCRY